MLAIDHVIVYVTDLESAAEELHRRHGLLSVAGGVHPELGTANRIVPLGRDYLELLTVVDHDRFAATGMTVPQRPCLWGWMARADDFDARAKRLSLDPIRMSRTRPDDTTLSWRFAGLHVAASEPALPMLIDWDPEQPEHPARTAVEGAQPAVGIAWLELQGDAARIEEWCGADTGLPLRVRQGPPAILAVGLATTDGRPAVELRSPLDM